MLFMDEKKYFASFDKTNFHFHPTNYVHPTLSSFDIRSLTLADDYAIECLFKLYQFYELFSEPVRINFIVISLSLLLLLFRLINILEKIMSVYYCLFIISLYRFDNYSNQIRQRSFNVNKQNKNILKSIFFPLCQIL